MAVTVPIGCRLACRVDDNAIPVLQISMPAQGNGYDCGVYVTKYASYLIQVWPPSRVELILFKFKGVFNPKEFDDEVMVVERRLLLELMASLRPAYEAIRDGVKARELKEKGERRLKKLNALAEAEAEAEGVAATEGVAASGVKGPAAEPEVESAGDGGSTAMDVCLEDSPPDTEGAEGMEGTEGTSEGPAVASGSAEASQESQEADTDAAAP